MRSRRSSRNRLPIAASCSARFCRIRPVAFAARSRVTDLVVHDHGDAHALETFHEHVVLIEQDN